MLYQFQPLTPRCETVLADREHALIGISPFNSYFSEARIESLLRWGLGTFQGINLFVPDRWASFTLEARGYDARRAAKKTRRQANYLRNRIHRAAEAAGVEDLDALILDAETLETNLRYLDLRERWTARFDADADFRAGCVAASSWVLQEHATRPTKAGRMSAVRYLLAELPMFADTVGILGLHSSVFCYHDTPAFLRDVYRGRYGDVVADGQAFVETRDRANDPVGARCTTGDLLGVDVEDELRPDAGEVAGQIGAEVEAAIPRV